MADDKGFWSTLRAIVTNGKVMTCAVVCAIGALALEDSYGSAASSLALAVGVVGGSLLLRHDAGAGARADCLRYGTGRGLRIFGVLGVIGFTVGLLVLVAADAMPVADRTAAAGFSAFGAVATYWTAIRPALVVCPDTVIVRRYGSSCELPIADLSFASGGTVLWLHRSTADPVRVMAVSTDNVTLALGKPGRAERAADEINALLGPSAVAAAEEFRPPRGVNWRLLLVLAVAATLQIGLVVAFQVLEDDEGGVDCVDRHFTLPSFGEYEATEVDACIPPRQP